MKKISVASIALVIALGVAACGSDNSAPVATGKAQLRVIHASPDAPAVDVYARGVATPLLTNVKFGDVSTYLSVDAASYVIDLRATGSAATSTPAFSTDSLAVPANAKITAVAMGLLGSTNMDEKFRISVFAEQFKPVASGTARVRIIHASADAPAVGLDVGDDGSVEIASLARWSETGVDGIELPAGQKLQIAIMAGATRVTAFTTPELPAGAELFVIATGLLSKLPRATDSFQLLAAAPAGAVGFIKQNPMVYALHASPDAPAVDIFAGSAQLVDNLAFAGLSRAIQVPPGSYTLDFFATAPGATRPAGAPAASATTPSLAAGERYLAAATGFLAPSGSQSNTFQLFPIQEAFEVDASNARVRAVHASPDAPIVDIGTVSGSSVSALAPLSNLGFLATSANEGVQIAPGTLSLGIAASGTTAAVATFSVPATAGARVLAVAAGALAPAGVKDQAFRLLLVNTAANPWTVTALSPQ